MFSRNGSGKSEAWTGFGKAESTMEKLLRQVRDPHRGLYTRVLLLKVVMLQLEFCSSSMAAGKHLDYSVQDGVAVLRYFETSLCISFFVTFLRHYGRVLRH